MFLQTCWLEARAHRTHANMAEHPYSADLVAEVQHLIDDSELAPNVKWGMVQAVLSREKILYKVEHVDPSSFLVHKCNRGKLGINAFEAHKHGHNIKLVGGCSAKLQESTAFELSPMLQERESQLKFNKRLVEGSNEMLGPIIGSERFVAVGSNHTAQFFKAVKHGCRTPIAAMCDADGRLSVQQYTKKDPFLHELVTRGWTWTILPWQTAIAWPALPSLVQFTLNASNSAVAQKSELEVAADIFCYAEALGKGGSPDYDAGMLQAVEARPPCVEYIDVIKRLCAMLDDRGLVVADLHDFVKKHGDTKVLGGEFIGSVVDARFFGGAPTFSSDEL
jgi:hypothetical protein